MCVEMFRGPTKFTILALKLVSTHHAPTYLRYPFVIVLLLFVFLQTLQLSQIDFTSRYIKMGYGVGDYPLWYYLIQPLM